MVMDTTASFEDYVQARRDALLRMACLITGSRNDAEDLLQTALAKTYLAWDRIEDKRVADAYLRRVMVNTNTSWWRRRKADEYPTETLPERAVDRDAIADRDLSDAIWTAMAQLSRRQRTVLVLRFYEDLSTAEIAETLGISQGTVKSTTSRALERIRDHLDLGEGAASPLATARAVPALFAGLAVA